MKLRLLLIAAALALASDATAGPLCQRLRDRIAARRGGCGAAQQVPAVAFRGAAPQACPGGGRPAPAVSYQFQPVGPAQTCGPNGCPLPARTR